jgi:hypothetical protein
LAFYQYEHSQLGSRNEWLNRTSPDGQALMDLRKAVELAADLPARPMRHIETKLAAFTVGISRAEQTIVPRESADRNEKE